MPKSNSIAKQQLSKDPVFSHIVDNYEPLSLSKTGNVYRELVRSIVYQQISYKAADKIYERLVGVIGAKDYRPADITTVSFDELKSAGLSKQKTQYIINISNFFAERNLVEANWDNYTDEEISKLLTEIKGVGQWTADMILIFELGRPDILPVKDLAIREAIKSLYKIKKEKKALIDEIYKIAEKWKPYRSLASLYLWSWYRVNG